MSSADTLATRNTLPMHDQSSALLCLICRCKETVHCKWLGGWGAGSKQGAPQCTGIRTLQNCYNWCGQALAVVVRRALSGAACPLVATLTAAPATARSAKAKSASSTSVPAHQAVKLCPIAWLHILAQLLDTVLAVVIQLRVSAVVFSNLHSTAQHSAARTAQQHGPSDRHHPRQQLLADRSCVLACAPIIAA
jgi:hypothetical protein